MKYNVIFRVLAACICLTPYFANGQDSIKIPKPVVKEVQFDFSLGALGNHHGSLNNVLKNNGWATLDNGLLTWNMSLKAVRGRFLFGFEWVDFESSVKKQNNLQTYLNCYLVEPYVGYAIIRTNKFRVYPYIGINSSFASLRLRDLSPVPNFSNVWTSSRPGADIDFNSYALDLGVHGEKLFYKKNRQWDCPQNTRYLALGFKFGYYLNLAESENGRFNGKRFDDSPTFHLNGFYGRLTLGIGTRLRQLNWN